jgi:hypothetical protein
MYAELVPTSTAEIDAAASRTHISRMITRYRLDPANPRQLTPEEARRLDEAPIDYSDIPELGDEFFSKAKHPAYVVINPLPPSRIEWLRQQSLRVAALFRSSHRKP